MPRNNNIPDIIIIVIAISAITTLYIINKIVVNNINLIKINNNNKDPLEQQYSWIIHGFFLNILGYSTLFLPGYLIYKYVRKINYLNNKSGSNKGLFSVLIRTCFGDENDDLIITTTSTNNSTQSNINNNQITIKTSAFHQAILLVTYFVGLQVCFLSWGILQEKVMTQAYKNGAGDVSYYKDSQFLVFVNRILAFLMSGGVLLICRQPRQPSTTKCPLYKYSFCSFSNIMSSWCQYEALKYVSFPHQVLSKAAKIIPVMIMGKIVSKAKYEYYEYVTAIILSIGMLFFMLDMGNNNNSTNSVTTCSGVILLLSYIVFDSFTASWQGALFQQYKMKPLQMMCFVNFFSCIFTAMSLLQQNSFTNSVDFMFKYPHFLWDCLLLSICSAGGQLFIFSTLATFGPVVFAIITTIRQGFSVLLSCIIYQHHINVLGVLGVVLVFISILLRIYCAHRLKTIRGLVIKTQRI